MEVARALEEKQRLARICIRHSLSLAQRHLDAGGELAWEWPRGNFAYQLPIVRSFLQKTRAVAFPNQAD